MNKDIMKNDKVKWFVLGYKAGWGDITTYKTNAELEEQASESYEGNKELLPTTDIDEVRKRLTWAMGVQGSPVGMLGDYEIDWIMNFFEPYLKGGE